MITTSSFERKIDTCEGADSNMVASDHESQPDQFIEPLSYNQMNETACYLCGSESEFRVLFPGQKSTEELRPEHIAARKGSINKEFSYNLVKCNRCGLVYANPAPDADFLEQTYEKSDQGLYQDENYNIAWSYGRYLRRFSGLLNRRGAALDVGAGDGFFLQELIDLGFQSVLGLEPSAEACRRAKTGVSPFLLNQSFRESDFRPGSLDFISCFQTLEHLPNPDRVVAGFHRLLAPGGMVYCVAHNFASWSVKVLGVRHPIINAGHLTLFDEETLKAFFEKHFNVLAVFKIANRYSISYWISLLPIPEHIKRTLIDTLTVSGLSNMPLTLSAGNIGLVAQKAIS